MEMVIWMVLLLAAGLQAGPTRDLADDADKFLLPWNIRPEHYDLTLFTHIEQFRDGDEGSFAFMGIVDINFLVLYGDLDEVVLHTYDDISIVSAQIVALDADSPHSFQVAIGEYDSETNKQSFQVSPALVNNDRYRITIYYIGNNNADLDGFYRSSYQDENNVKRWLLTTQFEIFGARRAFPSFDEPEYKATFKLTVHYNQTLAEQGYSAFFNTEIESEEIRNGVHVTTFKTTPRPLSTYLVAFIVAPFATSPEPAYFNSSFNGENPIKPLRTIGQPKYFSPRQDLLSQVAGPAALNVMTRLTGVGFGLDKVEQAGIPDFSAGAMENWGLVTYRESAVFFNNETGTTAQKQNVMSTTVHELAHQWFGDLVTLHWWSDVWLNEGYATFFETHAANEFREPDLNTSDWNLIGQFVSGTLQQSALRTDSRPTSRSLTAEAYDPAAIGGYFDGISYDKGGSVIRMWLHILGPEIFYAGLNRYLRQQEESVGTPEILLASWDGAVDALAPAQRPDLPATVASLFENWHLQAGYPVISVARQGGALTLTQERFLSSPGNDSSNKWNVPLSYSTNLEPNFNNTAPVAFLLASDASITLNLQNASADWVVVNNQETGYYRVNYDSDNWNKLIAIVNDSNTAGQIHEYNRAQILDDAANLGASTNKQYLSYDIVLRLLGSLQHERSLIVWTSALRAMDYLLTHLAAHEETSLKLREYFSSLVAPAFADLSLYVREADSHTDKLLRAALAPMACKLDLPACRQQASHLFASRSAHPDVRSLVMCEGVKAGDATVWEEVLSEALMAESPIRRDLLCALTCSPDASLRSRLLKMLANMDIFNDQDVMDVFSGIIDNNKGSAWLRDLSNIVDSRNLRSKSVWRQNTLNGLISMAAEAVTSIDDLDITLLSSENILTINNNRQWFLTRQPEILTWLSAESAVPKF